MGHGLCGMGWFQARWVRSEISGIALNGAGGLGPGVNDLEGLEG